MLRLPLILALILALTAPAAAAAPPTRADVHSLVARVLRAYGGRAALERVHAYRMEGTVFSAMRHSDAPTVRIFARPDRFKALIAYEGGSEARLADGQKVWRNDPGGPMEPARGPMWAAVLLQAMRANVPWVLAERESLLQIDPDAEPPAGVLEKQDGKPVKLLGISFHAREGLGFRAWIDPNGMVIVSQGLLDHGGMQTHFETVYSDFREVDGVKFAFHEDNWASGVRTGITTVKNVMLNPELRPDEFQLPKPGEGKGGD